MTKLARLPLITLGTHQAPQGPVPVTAQRVEHWIKSFNEMKSDGNNVPVPWGHQLKAVPAGDKEAEKYAKARWNASFFERLEKTPNGVDLVFPVPPGWDIEDGTGDLINPADGCRIREVSAGIGNWRDGRGKVYRDCIVHAALCTLPVVAGQKGFTATLATDDAIYTATLDTDGVEYLYTLGSREKTMKDEPADLDIEAVNDLPPIAAPSPIPPVTPDGQVANDIIALMGAVDGGLPPDTNPQNLLQNLKVTLTVLAAKGFKFCTPNQNDKPADAKIDVSTEGATPESMGPATAYMSTEPDQTVMLSTDASAMAETWAQSLKVAYAREWDALKARGLPDESARQEKARLDKSKPAIDPVTRQVSLPDAKSRLQLARGASGTRATVQAALTTVAPTTPKGAAPKVEPVVTLGTEPAPDATVEPNPMTRNGGNGGFDQKAFNAEMAAAAGLQMKDAA